MIKRPLCVVLMLLALSTMLSCTNQDAPNSFYLSPRGDDSALGSKSNPWRSWNRALEGVREARKSNPEEGVTIYFAGGEYTAEQVVMDSTIRGTELAPVRFVALTGETPTFTGGVRLNNWRAITEAPELLQEGVAEHLYVCDLSEVGVTDLGDATDLGERPELFCNGELQQLARWPNNEMTHAGKALGATPAPENWAGFVGTIEGKFAYTSPRQNRWSEESDPRLGGYWFWDWSEEFQRVECFDTINQMITIAEPYHNYGYKDSLRYFGANLLCELDQPKEWYLDRENALLYWYPEAPITPTTEVILSVFDAPFMLSMQGCEFVTVQGLSFEYSRGSGIEMIDCSDSRIEGCRLLAMGRDGIHIRGGWRCGVADSWLEGLGCSGIHLIGGDRKTLTPAHHYVENTMVKHFSRFKRTYQPAIYAKGCGLSIAHNVFTRSSSSAMRLAGNEILVEYNRITRVVEESDDQGGIDIYYNPSYQGIVVRNNYWGDIIGGTHCGAAGIRTDDMISGLHIYGNLFERCGALMFGGVQINGGKGNRVDNNLFVDCSAAVSLSMPWDEQKWFFHLNRDILKAKIYEEVDIRQEPYLSRYPILSTLEDTRTMNVNIVENNLLVGCEQEFINFNDRQIVRGNTMIPNEGLSLEELTEPSYLRRYGIHKEIPYAEMGLQNNPWESK